MFLNHLLSQDPDLAATTLQILQALLITSCPQPLHLLPKPPHICHSFLWSLQMRNQIGAEMQGQRSEGLISQSTTPVSSLLSRREALITAPIGLSISEGTGATSPHIQAGKRRKSSPEPCIPASGHTALPTWKNLGRPTMPRPSRLVWCGG